MNSETSRVAFDYRHQKWADQIRECQNRPADVSVASWCAEHGITKASYYYRLRQVRGEYLEHIRCESPAQQIIPVDPSLLQMDCENDFDQPGLDISTNGFSIHVTKSTPASLLTMVLEVVRNAK